MRTVHRGEILRANYLKPLSLSANALAKLLDVSASRINDLVLERRAVSADTALRFVQCFAGDAQELVELASGLRSEDCAEK